MELPSTTFIVNHNEASSNTGAVRPLFWEGSKRLLDVPDRPVVSNCGKPTEGLSELVNCYPEFADIFMAELENRML